MKRNFLVLALSVLTGISAMAQEKEWESGNPEEEAREMTERMVNRFDLSEEQYEQAYEANLELAEARYKHREEMRKLHLHHDKRMRDILDEEQFKRYQKQKVERMEKRQERQENRPQHMQRMEQKRDVDPPARRKKN